MIYQQLFKKYGNHKKCQVALIGAGAYGTAVVTQQARLKDLTVSVIADLSAESAARALDRADIPETERKYCRTPAEASAAIAEGFYVYTDHPELIFSLPEIDIVCESTGSPYAGAEYAEKAILAGKHVAMITKDCDAAVGPALKALADRHGVVYTPVDGDQHGLLIQLVEWGKLLGLEILCAGKATDGEFIYDRAAGTVTIQTDKKITPPSVKTVFVRPEDRPYLELIPDGKSAEYLEKRREILKDLPQPGAYDYCEMLIAANYTGFHPQTPSLLHMPLRIRELPEAYALSENGGLIQSPDTIDMVTCFREPDEAGLGGGVFMVVRCNNAYSNMVLTTKGQIANHDGTAAVIYRPYHLCGVETPVSLYVAANLGLNTASEHYFAAYTLVKTAARDFKAGEIFGGDHDPDLKAAILPTSEAGKKGYAEGHLIRGCRAAKDIPAGTIITLDMVDIPKNSTLWRLRQEL